MGPAALLTTVLLMLLGIWLSDALAPIRPYKSALWAAHGGFITLYIAVFALNLFAASLWLVRKLGLQTAGRKLAHLDSELHGEHALAADIAGMSDADSLEDANPEAE